MLAHHDDLVGHGGGVVGADGRQRFRAGRQGDALFVQADDMMAAVRQADHDHAVDAAQPVDRVRQFGAELARIQRPRGGGGGKDGQQ